MSIDWQKIRTEYETTGITLQALGEKYDIKYPTIKSRKQRQGWQKQDASKGKKDASMKAKDASKRKVQKAPAKAKKGDELTPKQSLFVKEYLIDLNATQAAIRAGYSEKTAQEQGSRLLSNVIVSQAVNQAQAERSEKLEVTADWVLERLKLISDRCVQGEPVLDREGNPTGEWRFDSSGANKATELIGKHLGMFIERKEITGRDGQPIQIKSDVDLSTLTDEELIQLENIVQKDKSTYN